MAIVQATFNKHAYRHSDDYKKAAKLFHTIQIGWQQALARYGFSLNLADSHCFSFADINPAQYPEKPSVFIHIILEKAEANLSSEKQDELVDRIAEFYFQACRGLAQTPCTLKVYLRNGIEVTEQIFNPAGNRIS